MKRKSLNETFYHLLFLNRLELYDDQYNLSHAQKTHLIEIK